ncbi:class I SAM-dependent DNA methyltransferase [Streptomyces drozdowiczii]|uniref:Class I SAM-dependent methyltransferase n=1 Tax=Streptomyces drozdowiczii TaxID=202862 RepID=A0ABY6PQS8_9ACTN|nr:class I SAM-dependent methyltransferase [Streptomyces drozdowiczii]MCX0245850.1 class I SAM-dependent methyltransferase [Streptomyces drozdowiczii]UZK54563.1 class I SAM-dependent methyltransferase [Streptomyces drozdowiczii]
MTELDATRAYYDTVAEDYAARVPGLFAEDVAGRALIGAFAEEVRADGGLPVADLGCGPGHVTAHLAGLGLSVHGVDVSPRMVDLARRRHPELRFETGTMDALGLPDGGLGGIVAWWSILHTPPDRLPVLFAEFRRVLAPGGRLLLGFHAGNGEPYVSEKRAGGYAYAIHLLSPDRVVGQLEEAGFALTARLTTPGARWPQVCLLARAAGA